MISVIVPIYNVAPYLCEAIDSVLRQTYTDLEIILVNDGSTDGSGKICEQYLHVDSRIRVIHQQRRGLSAARNVGLNICQGEMISFLDPDDAYCSNMLQCMSEAMQKYHSDIVECDFSVYNSNQTMKPQTIMKNRIYASSNARQEGLYQKQEALHMQLKGKLATNVWNKLYKKKIWENLRFRDGQNYEDVDAILSILGEADCIYILDEPLIMHRNRRGSITSTYSIQNLKDLVLAYQHYTEFVYRHIPEYFCEDDLVAAQIKSLKTLLIRYFTCACSLITGRSHYLKEIKAQIFKVEKDINNKKLGIRVRAAIFLFHNAPAFAAGLIFELDRLFRSLMLKMISK